MIIQKPKNKKRETDDFLNRYARLIIDIANIKSLPKKQVSRSSSTDRGVNS